MDAIDFIIKDGLASDEVKNIIDNADELFQLDDDCHHLENVLSANQQEIERIEKIDEWDERVIKNPRWLETQLLHATKLKGDTVVQEKEIQRKREEYDAKVPLVEVDIQRFLERNYITTPVSFDEFYNRWNSIREASPLEKYRETLGRENPGERITLLRDVQLSNSLVIRYYNVVFKIDAPLGRRAGVNEHKTWSYVKYRISDGTRSMTLIVWDPDTFLSGACANLAVGTVCYLSHLSLEEFAYTYVDKKDLQLKPSSLSRFRVL